MEHINSQGKYEGILADFAYLIASKLHIPFVLQPTRDYHQSLAYVKTGRCDLIVGDEPEGARKKHLLATKPYYIAPRVFVTHIDTPIVHDLSQLVPMGKIGVQTNSPAEAILPKRYPDIRLETFDSVDEGVRKVASDELVAFVNTLPVLVYSITHQGLENVKLAGSLDQPVRFSMLVTPSDEPLVPILNKAIDAITAEERQSIIDKWIHVTYEKGIDDSMIFKVTAILLIILIALLYRNHYVQKMNFKLAKMHRQLEDRMHREVEKNRQQEMFMLQQNRLAQMGEMLSMIAHQWRQPLNTLTLVNQMLVLKYKMKKLDDEVLKSFEQKTKQLIHQMSQTIDDFKDFFKPEKQPQRFIINEAVEHAVAIIEPILHDYDITLHVEAEEKIGTVGYPNEFGQAIVNILGNAKDVLTEKKRGDRSIQLILQKEHDFARIQICDNGGGIAEETLPKIFDPYFSTKDEKNGTGLGLYMCKIIVEEHMNGTIRAFNHVDGACFILMLPLSPETH